VTVTRRAYRSGDGEYLIKTINDLAVRYPTVESIAIVPAGLSKHRKNKTPIGAIEAQYSTDILDMVKRKQHEFMEKHGTKLVWAADEFYLSAGRPVPASEAYEGFPQIENGIGLVRKFKDSARRAKRIMPNLVDKSFTISTVTGTLAAPLVKDWADSVATEKLKINVYPIVNELFGETVTVTGLISGKDIINQLKGKELGDVLFIPSVSLRDNTFLDDVTIDQVASELGIKVEVVEPRPYQMVKRIAEIAGSPAA
jgi:putative radical SAM enzyme (TIGR03279 family)